MKEYLEILRQNQQFLDMLKEINKHRPLLPRHTLEPDNTEHWKAMSWMQQGFDLYASLLGEDNE